MVLNLDFVFCCEIDVNGGSDLGDPHKHLDPVIISKQIAACDELV